MIITNIDTVPDKKISKVVGVVRGNVVGSRPVDESIWKSVTKAMASTLSLAPKIITGEEVGLVPEDEMKEKNGEEEMVANCENELEEYSALLTRLRDTALERMIKHAQSRSADAVINVHFDVSVIFRHTFEVCAYGTAVNLQ